MSTQPLRRAIASLNACLLVFSLFLLLMGLCATRAISQSPPRNTIIGPGSAIPWNGKNWYLSGANYAWQNYGTDFGTGGWGKFTNWAQVGKDFTTMKAQGVLTVRWWVFADGRYAPDFNPDGTVSGLDSSVFSDIDQALAIAAKNNTYLILTLVDFHMWTAPVSSGSVTGGGHNAMLSDARTQQSYLDNALKPLLQHIAASPYKNFVLAYDIVNEPEWTIGGLGGGSSSISVAQVQTFAQKCAAYIHQYGGGAYATLGAATPSWVGNWKGVGLDFYQVHYYPNYDWNGPGSGLPTYASLNLDRPCIVGEFATNDRSYKIGDTTPLSAQWYVNTIANYGYAGALAWGYHNMDSECNWASFQPVYINWAVAHRFVIGPQ